MAVYTELADDEIRALLSAYDLAPLERAEGIRSGVENTNYLLFLQDSTRLILTLFEKRVAEGDLPFFSGLMERLSAKAVPCPMPIRAMNGQPIQRIKGKSAILVSFLEGKSVTAISNAHMAGLGAVLAQMHIAGQGYERKRANALALAGWGSIVEKIGARADTLAPGLAHELESEMRMLAGFWPKHLPEGVIHADLFPDNVFYDAGDRLTGIIDFYFACNDFLMYDLAVCLNAWCFEKTLEFNITRARHMLRGYNEVRALSQEELAALPVLARGAALRFLLTRAHDWLFPVEGAQVTAKDPLEYLKKLRFHREVQHHREYGL